LCNAAYSPHKSFGRAERNCFCAAEEERVLQAAGHGIGATVAFTGWVRDINENAAVSSLFLEHYPGMTERTIEQIARDAAVRWELLAVTVIHRVGLLRAGEHIVYVGVAGAHRGAAFAAGEFIMDFLKTRAPFWKKETTADGERWLDARESDRSASERWSG
jgi:molybdopterin synthase catalytic subunit